MFTARSDALRHALLEIYGTYGADCKIKNKSLIKFGSTAKTIANQWVTVMELPGTQAHETYITNNTNGINRIVSDDNSDTGTYNIEGHTNDGSGNLTFVVQQATLTGQTAVTLTTPLNRVSRIAPITGQTTATAGNIQVYESSGATVTAGVVSPDTKVHILLTSDGVTDADERSQKASTSFSSVDYGILLDFGCGFIKNSGSGAEATFRLMIRKNPNDVFQQIAGPISISGTGASGDEDFDIYPIVPANYDIRIECLSATNNLNVNAYFQAFIATVR